MLSLFKVQGQSMQPTLHGGDYVVTSRLYFCVHIGDLVVVDHPTYKKIIKRVVDISKNKGVRLQGDNDCSVSEDAMGWLKKDTIKGKVLWTIKQA